MDWFQFFKSWWCEARCKYLACLGFVLAIAQVSVAAMAAQERPIDLNRYVGLWYELARTPNDNQDDTPTHSGKSFSTCTATTATYTARDENTLMIRNVCVRKASDGSTFEDVAEGTARLVDDSSGRKFKVAFGSAFSQFFQRLISFGGFNYWIFAIDETATSAPYRWAVVSGPDRDFLFLLTRDRFPSAEVKAQIMSAAKTAGLPVDKLVFKQE